ncbi:MAG: SMI1/KNR4 family protein [Planctomycetes bacterium]|nr:SMI1/KNR4 family protein [Planctomycetota bacterium]
MDELESRLTALDIHPMNADAYTPVPESELQQLEGEIGSHLPEDYRWFLNRYGESSFKMAVSYPSSQIPGGYSFGFYFGANASGDGVLANYNFYKGQFPKGVVPIGEASLGDLYLLATTGPNRGSVYYWCHDGGGWEDEAEEYSSRGQAVPDSVKYSCLEQVAPSFTSFVLGLQPDED